MEFEINGLQWVIEQVDSDRTELNESDGVYCGLTDYLRCHISIRDGMGDVSTRRTVIHELVHAFLWSYGMYTDQYDNEQVCRFCENHLDHILDITDKYMGWLHEQADKRGSESGTEGRKAYYSIT